MVLLSDGADNSGGIDLDTISTLRSRQIPVHTVGFGLEQVAHDVEINDAVVAPRALADSRLAAKVTLHQRGYAGQKATLTVRDGDKVLAAREITLAADGATQNETLLFNAGRAGAKTLQFSDRPAARRGESRQQFRHAARQRRIRASAASCMSKASRAGNTNSSAAPRRTTASCTIVSMLRTSENKIYRQGIDDPKELADGFPSRAEDLFAYQALIIGSVEASYFTPAQQDLIQQFVDRRGGGLLFLGGRASLARWRLGGIEPGGSAAGHSAEQKGYVSSRSRDGFADAGGRGQHHHAAGRRSGDERGALEEAALPDGLSGSRARRNPARRCWRK